MVDDSKSYRTSPTAYKVPFTNEEALLIGHFTAIWGQIDFFLGNCIAFMLKVEIGAAQILMEGMTTGPRLNLFRRLVRQKIADPAILKTSKSFADSLSPLIDKRNQIMHGMWGTNVDQTHPANNETAALHSRYREPLKISELPKLIERLAVQSFAIATVWQHLSGYHWVRNDANPPVFLMGVGPPSKPPQELLG